MHDEDEANHDSSFIIPILSTCVISEKREPPTPIMATSEEAKFNFSKVSSRDALAFGSARPGFPSKEASQEEITAWSAFMKVKGIKRVLSLLGDDEKTYYKVDIDAAMIAEFGAANYTRISVFSPDARDVLSGALNTAREAGDTIVMHCSGGEGRAALAMGLWLVDGYGLAPDDAAGEVQDETEKNPGIARRVNVAKLSHLVLKGTMTGFSK